MKTSQTMPQIKRNYTQKALEING